MAQTNIKNYEQACRYLEDDLTPGKFVQLRNVGKIFYNRHRRSLISLKKFAKDYNVSIDGLIAIQYVSNKSGCIYKIDVDEIRRSIYQPRELVEKAVEKWFDTQFVQTNLYNADSILNFARKYCSKQRQINLEKSNKQRQRQPTYSSRGKRKSQRPNRSGHIIATSTKTSRQPLQITRIGVYWFLLIACLVVGVVYDNGPLQVHAQLISILVAAVMTVVFNDQQIGWRKYALLLVSFECLVDQPLLSIVLVLLIIPVLRIQGITLIRRAIIKVSKTFRH
ncbi:hypothetical protein [Lentilactobacillus diolivorans]|uniref:Uncharacterized protein n=2 Tax=Lentilactobacillus diolivorans TaxID=179838 RepID=A0A0R1S7D0_9LACO|nr:hypothetical protein [Lentilactobacillus diolivorans]KRL64398.1 hypothetical protein FC85_GL000908 [Lentilactobacillus diolivorans DSM 14421]GEP23107.1 hypothetical protein LDI01_07000 [Lentilactobacillus diolivorans]